MDRSGNWGCCPSSKACPGLGEQEQRVPDREAGRRSPVNWPRKLMGRLHKAHTGQSRDHPIGAPPTLQMASARALSGFRTDQTGKWLSTG